LSQTKDLKTALIPPTRPSIKPPDNVNFHVNLDNRGVTDTIDAVGKLMTQMLETFTAHLAAQDRTFAEMSRQITRQCENMAGMMEKMPVPQAPMAAAVKPRSYDVKFSRDDAGETQGLRIVARGE